MMMRMTQQQTAATVPEWTMGDRLGKALGHAGIGVGEMADYLGVSRNTVGNYINDRRSIPRPTLMLWAMRTGVPLEWLESGEMGGSTPPPNPGPGKQTEAMKRLTDAKKAGTRQRTTNSRYAPALVAA